MVDDFGHHPTAIRETLRALAHEISRSEKIWAVFEPRTNTTRRNVFQNELAGAFADADAVVVAEVARLEQLAPEERLDPEKLMQDLKNAGKDAAYLPDADAIVAHIVEARPGRRRRRACSATAALAASTENCCNSWAGDSLKAKSSTEMIGGAFFLGMDYWLNVTLPECVSVFPFGPVVVTVRSMVLSSRWSSPRDRRFSRWRR